jgi:UDP-N-acetylglucosamine enolpyruvyl transferase
MCASGETEIADFHHAERGYEDLAGRLTSLGAVLRIDGS